MWQPPPLFLPGESQGRGSLVGCRLWGHTELDTTEVTKQQQQQQQQKPELYNIWLLSFSSATQGKISLFKYWRKIITLAFNKEGLHMQI